MIYVQVVADLMEPLIISCGARRTEIFLASVDEIVKWMYKSNTDPNVVKLVEDYLQQCGDFSMHMVASPFLPQKHHLLVEYHDKLRW